MSAAAIAKKVVPTRIYRKLSKLRHYPAHLGAWLFDDTMDGAHSSMRLSQRMNPRDFARRRAAMLEVGAKSPDRISFAAGHLIANWGAKPVVAAAVARGQAFAETLDFPAMAAKASKPFLLSAPIDPNDPANAPIYDLAADPLLLAPIASYLGSYPVLNGARIWYSPNTYLEANRSQFFHLDDEDYRQIKCYVLLDEVDSDTGPFTLIPADASRAIYGVLGNLGLSQKRNQKFTDEKFAEAKALAGQGTVRPVEIVGPTGTVGMVDTNNCYHFGSRPGKRRRLLLFLHYYSAFSRELPFWNRRYRKVPGGPEAQLLNGLSHLSIDGMRGY